MPFSQLDAGEEEERTAVVKLCVTYLRALLAPGGETFAEELPAEVFRLLETGAAPAGVTFAVGAAAEKSILIVEGLFDQEIPFDTLVPTPLGKLLGDQARALFAGRRLVSVTLSPSATAELVTRLSRHPEEVDTGEVIREEHVVKATRDLPWSIRVALARLAFPEADPERVLAPLLYRMPLVEQLVTNLDLVPRSGRGGGLAHRLLLALPWRHLSTLCAVHLSGWVPPDCWSPEGVRDAVRGLLPVIELRANPARFLGVLDGLRDLAAYERLMLVALRELPKLLAESRFQDAQRVIELVLRHRAAQETSPDRWEMLGSILTDLDLYGVTDGLVEVMCSGRRLARQQVVQLLLAMEFAAVPVVLRVLEQESSPEACQEAARVLASAAAPDWVAALMKETELPPNATRYLIKVLGRVGTPAHVRILGAYLKSPDPSVRYEAIGAAFELGGEDALPLLLRGFLDPSAEIVRKCIRLLQRLGYCNRAYVLRLLALVSGSGSPSPEAEGWGGSPEAVQVAALEALGKMGNIVIEHGGPTLEDRFLELLPTTAVRDRRPHELPRVRAAVCDALSEMGGPAALAALSDTSREPDRRVRVAMSRAAAAIQRRMAGDAE